MNLIQDTLELIRQRLNEYFQAADPSPEDWVILSNIVDQDGAAFEQARNKVVIFLANIQHDTTISTWRPAVPTAGDRYAIVPPPLYINLFLLFFANFSEKNYPMGLGMISRTIAFFQENPLFDHYNLPDLPAPVDKLAFEFTNLDAQGLNYLMGLAGVNYLPSVYYKVRMLPFRREVIQEQASAAQGYSLGSDPCDDESDVDAK
jgi:Pvc16 N-terminal domain